MGKTVNQMYLIFQHNHLDLCERGMVKSLDKSGRLEIVIPSRGTLLYDADFDSIEWVNERKVVNKDISRNEAYEKFCEVVEEYIHVNHISHQRFADMVGISRFMLSQYLNEHAVPKLSTMKRICESIGVDI